MSDSNVEIVDDRDPRVKYSDGWAPSGGNHEFGGTTHGTFLAGSKATFTFNGSSVEVYGTMGIDHKDPPVSTYSLDGSSLQTFNPPLPNAIQYQQLFFKSPTLDDKQHVLVVTSTISETAFWLDYFRIASNSISSPLSDPVSSVTPTTLSTSSPSVSGMPPTTPTNTPKLSINRTLIAAIAGGVAGGVLLVLLVFFFVFCYRRKRRFQKAAFGSSTHPDGSCEHRVLNSACH
ncbi:hypothetical protein BDZ94DRAFT_1176202 [Collybia nuda]|uniref:Uncharacterized protein n=1 Tax=Collybia nuda TaxID=64659 RepID=A0A9P6CCH6_9AGAR|nr:hypothetical protein BDZ94DRAFT_1176202 [Collybia nuda]